MCKEPGTAKSVRKSLHFASTTIPFSNYEALAQLILNNLTKNQNTFAVQFFRVNSSD